MKPGVRRRITAQALEGRVSPVALENIIAANRGQSALRYQIGHGHFHYDHNAFSAGNAYLDQMRRAGSNPPVAW